MFILNLFGIAISLPFLLIPIIFGIAFLTQYLTDDLLRDPFNDFLDSPYFNVTNLIIICFLLFILIPIISAYFTRGRVKKQPIKFSLFKSDKSYLTTNISGGGISSGGFSSSSSSSSSSFSGGGGSSSGGGSSGSW
jgi:uncharacterized protein